MEYMGEVTVTVLGLDQSRYQAEIDAGLREQEALRHAALVDRQRRLLLREEEQRRHGTVAEAKEGDGDDVEEEVAAHSGGGGGRGAAGHDESEGDGVV
jgi:hypothetical protein